MTRATLLSIFLMSMVVTGCEASASKSLLEMNFSNREQGVKEYTFQLNDEGELHMTGSIELESGEIILTIKSLDRDRTFYTKIFNHSEAITIDIEDGDKNESFLLLAEFYDAKNIHVKLESSYKLLPHPETPEKPEHSVKQ